MKKLFFTMFFALIFCFCENYLMGSNTNSDRNCELRTGGQNGSVAYRIDGNEVRGVGNITATYYIDGNEVRTGRYGGDVVYYVDGNEVRSGGKYGSIAYYIDGNEIRSGGRYGSVVYYLDCK